MGVGEVAQSGEVTVRRVVRAERGLQDQARDLALMTHQQLLGRG